MELLTPLSPDERALLLREAEAACAAKKHFGGTQSLFWLRHLCKCANRQEEIAFHNRRHREFQKLIGTKEYRDPVAAVDAQGSRLRRELEAFPFDSGRVVTLTPGEWGLAWKTIEPEASKREERPLEFLARVTGKVHVVVGRAEYLPVVSQLIVLDLAPPAAYRYTCGNEWPVLEAADALVAVGTPEDNIVIAELADPEWGIQSVEFHATRGALLIPCSDANDGLRLLWRASRGQQREGGASGRVAI